MQKENLIEKKERLNERAFILQKEITERREELDKTRSLLIHNEEEYKGLQQLSTHSSDAKFLKALEQHIAEVGHQIENEQVLKADIEIDLSRKRTELEETYRQMQLIEESIELDKRQKRNLEEINRYDSFSDADQDAFSELVNAAIGNRSMRQFASEIGYNVSSISRIVNKKLRGQCSDEMLAAIAAHSAEGSEVTVEKLMNALGKKKVLLPEEFEQSTKNVIRNEILDRGYSIKEEVPEKTFGPAFSYRFDYMIKTNAFIQNEATWVFDFKSIRTSDAAKTTAIDGSINQIRQMLIMLMSLLYCGALKVDKVSICIDHKGAFNKLKKQLVDIKVKDNISIILIENKRVVDEYIIPRQDGKTCDSIFLAEQSDKEPTKEKTNMAWDEGLLEKV